MKSKAKVGGGSERRAAKAKEATLRRYWVVERTRGDPEVREYLGEGEWVPDSFHALLFHSQERAETARPKGATVEEVFRPVPF